MRCIPKLALVLAGALLFTVPARAQNFITVTATVTDPSGIPYAGGTMSAVLVPGSPGGWTLGGQPYSGRVGPIGLDSTGSFTANFGSNAAILPASSQWQITVNSNPGGIAPPLGTGAQSFTVTMTISGPSPQSISSTLNAAAPKLTNFAVGGTVTSFSAGNLSPLFTTSVATPSSTPALSFAQVTQNPNVFYGGPASGVAANPTFRALVPADLPATPTVLDCSQQPGADMGAQLNACLAALPAAGGIADATKFSSPQTISTAVVNSFSATITTCGLAISQSATITLSGAGSSWAACLDSPTVITKAANLDQFTLSGANAVLSSVTLAGVSASFTGNGVVTATGCVNCKVILNVIGGEANDDIFDNSGTFTSNVFEMNTLTTWGVHAYQSTSSSQQSVFTANYAQGNGSSTGAAILNAGSATLSSNYVKDSNATILVDDSGASQTHPVTGNRFQQTNTQTALKTGGNTLATANQINGGGTNGPGVNAQLGGVVSGNGVTTSAADGIDAGNNAVIENNFVAVTYSGVSNKCGINVLGDVIGARVANNVVAVTDVAADTNYGVCSTPNGTHNLDNIFDGNHVQGTLSGGATVFGFWMNNGNNLNTNWSPLVQNLSCVHITTCLKRTDTQNNKSTYINIIPGDATFDNGTGSTADVFVENQLNFTFATLPSPAGNGSIITNCTDCKNTTPTAASGSGATVTRNNGVWFGGAVDSTGKVTGTTYATATNCSGVGTAANPSVATCTAAAAGSFSCATNASTGTCTVNTTAVTANSQIFVQEDDSLGTKLGVTCNTNNVLPTSAPLLGARSGGTSFTINLGTFATNPLCFSYFIVN